MIKFYIQPTSIFNTGTIQLLFLCCEGHWLANSIPVRLSTERTPANTNCCFRNKFTLVVTYGKVPCFYFLEKALSLH